MNKDIRDKVYIDGQWIDDYFLTKEKNQELKNLRDDLTDEILLRKNSDKELNNSIEALDKKSTELDAEIYADLNKEQHDRIIADKKISDKLDEETETRNTQTNILENLINQEKERAITEEDVIKALVEALRTDSEATYRKIEDSYTKAETNSEIDNAIKAVLGDGVDDAFDTLKEIAE